MQSHPASLLVHTGSLAAVHQSHIGASESLTDSNHLNRSLNKMNYQALSTERQYSMATSFPHSYGHPNRAMDTNASPTLRPSYVDHFKHLCSR